jgi:predicted transcriptional regulator of viral defense system
VKIDRLRSRFSRVFTTAEARSAGVSPQLLRHYLGKGWVERAGHGLYRFPSDEDLDLESQIHELLKAVPQAVISHRTALRLFGLTEEAPPKIDLIVPDKNVPKRRLEDVELHPVAASLLRSGLTRVRGIPVTGIERTCVDLLRDGESISFVLSVFREAQEKNLKPSLVRIRKLGAQLRAKERAGGGGFHGYQFRRYGGDRVHPA